MARSKTEAAGPSHEARADAREAREGMAGSVIALREAVDWSACAGLVVAYAFGSRCEGRARPDSDLDVAAVLSGPGAETLDGSQRLAKIETAIQRAAQAPVDFVLLPEQPLAFQYNVVSQGALLYERSRGERALYEADLFSRYFDFLPTLRLFERYHMQGIRRRLARL